MDQVQAEQIALGQLDGGERLLWSGSPSPGAAAVRALPATLIGIPFALFAAFWIWTAYAATARASGVPGPWMFFPLFGIPFLLIGLGVMAAPLWIYLAAGKTVYALTEKRALIIVGAPLRTVQSYAHADLGEIVRLERADGSGSVFFASRAVASSRGMQRLARVGFEGISEVRRVEQLIRDHLRSNAA